LLVLPTTSRTPTLLRDWETPEDIYLI